MRRGERWFLLPEIVRGGAVIYAILLALEAMLRWLAGVPFGPGKVGGMPSYVVLLFVAGLYGFGRVVRFHPELLPRYKPWLATVPWRPGMPLPLGPVHPVGRDLLVLVPLALLAQFASGGSWAVPLLVFGVAYLVPMWVAFLGRGWWACALAVGFAGLVRAAGDVPVTAAIVVAMLAAALLGLRQSMPRQELKPDTKPSAAGLGSPFEELAPVPPPTPVPLAHAAAYAGLAGWWVYCVVAVVWPDANRVSTVLVTSALCTMAAVQRLVVYLAGSAPPLDLRGRWTTGRWVLPGYDHILIAPLVVLLVAISLPPALAQAGLPVAVLAGVSSTAVLLLAIILPPTRARWRLTGQRHLVRRSGGSGEGKPLKLAS